MYWTDYVNCNFNLCMKLCILCLNCNLHHLYGYNLWGLSNYFGDTMTTYVHVLYIIRIVLTLYIFYLGILYNFRLLTYNYYTNIIYTCIIILLHIFIILILYLIYIILK